MQEELLKANAICVMICLYRFISLEQKNECLKVMPSCMLPLVNRSKHSQIFVNGEYRVKDLL